MDVTAEQLRNMIFRAEQEHTQALGGSAPIPAAKAAQLQLQCLLSARAAQSPALAQQAAGLLEQCATRLQALRVHASRAESRKAELGRVLSKAGCQDGFKFCNPKGFSLEQDLKSVEPFKQILQAVPAAQRVQPAREDAEAPLGERSNIPQLPHQAAWPKAQPAKQMLAPQHQQQQQQGLLPQQAPPQEPAQRSGFQVPPPSRSGHLASAASALRQPTAQQQPQQQPAGHQHCGWGPHPQQGPPPGHQPGAGPTVEGPRAAGPGAAVGFPYDADPPAALVAAAQESKWVPPKMPRRAQDAHVHHARQQQHQQGRDEESIEVPDEESMEEPGRGMGNPFQSAKARLVADMRKSGQPYNAPVYGNQGPPPRQGLIRPGGGGRGRRPMQGAGQGGVNKGFVPPFVKRALDGQNGGGGAGGQGGGEQEADGPLTLRTREFLRLGPDDPLPEELAKLDPQLIEQVCNEVVETGKTSWDDIAGQQVAKKLIQEVVVWPLLNPHIFTGARAPPKGILLFGPPGTGKTLLGKAIASNINATFFSISASSLTSKWIGEGEKMVRTLFAVAGWVAPSLIFIDEIDSLLSARKSEGEHEASRRLKTEMLVQMEGCDPNSSDRRVLIIGATNRPEELDEAARRRMPKQLYIPLPDADARRGMVLRQLGPGAPIRAALSEADVAKVVKNTEGYSGSDMKNLIQEACQGPVRDAVKQHGAGVASLQAEDLRPVVLKDFALAARAQKASVEPSEVVRYEQYNEKHGAKILQEEEIEGMEDDDW